MKDMTQRIQNAYERLAPDVLDGVLSDLHPQKGAVIFMTESKRRHPRLRRLGSLAAAFVLLAGSLWGVSSYRHNYAVASTVALDVNPSLEIQVNEQQKVLDVIAKNDEALQVLDGMDFSGSDINLTINALIGSMLRHGYLSDIANSILITVDSEDPSTGAALQALLAEHVDQLLQTELSGGSVLSQTIHTDTELKQLAESYNISSGKAELIRQIVAGDPRHSVEELAGLSINDLNLLINAHGTALESVESTGAASEKSYIGREAAIAAALEHAGVSEADASFLQTELDWENGEMVYEIDFYANGREYEYDVSARSGEVRRSESEREYHPAADTAAADAAPTDTADESDAEAAIAAALARAGLSRDEVRNLRCEPDNDDGRLVYEIEFDAGLYEYSCEVGTDGSVYDFEKEFID